MAAYAATVTSPLRKPIKIGNGVGIYFGQINLTNYNSTLAEITAITGKFNDKTPIVTLSGVSESGYICHWDPTSKAVKAFYPTAAAGTHTHTGPSHSHTIAVTAGTAGDAVTNNAGVLESTGGQDLTTAAGGTGATGAGGAISATAGTEVANDVDVGLVYFQAVGMMKV